MKYRFVLLKNALANVVRGSASALVSLLVPPFLTHAMDTTAYGVWSLVLQLSSYVGYLDFGIQTAVGRFVAHANEFNDAQQRDRIVSTSFAMLAGSAVLAMILVLVLAWQLPNLFRDMPANLRADARLSLLFIGGSLAVGLPFSVFNGIFIGLQRYEVPAAIIGGGKLIGAALVVMVARLGGGMALMGIVMMVANLASYVLQFLACKKTASCVRISTKLISRQAGREIGAYCFSLSIWAFATLLVTGLDTTIVGLFDFKSVAYYAVAATVITFILGLQNALFNVLVPAAAVLEARKDAERLGNLLITSTRYSMFALLVTCLPLIVMAKSIISAWVGSEYVASTAILLQVLLVANIVRLSAVPYAMLLIGTGNQRLVTVSPLVEGLSNLLVSVIAGSMLGAVGVAIGTLIGSLIGVGFNLIYNMPRTRAIAIQRCIYLRDGIARALVCAVPAVTLVPATLILHFQSVFTALLLTIILAFTLVLIWNWGLVSSERQKILSMMHIIPSALCK